MPPDSAGENEALEISAFLHEAGELVVLGDADDVLLDDGAFVQDFGDIVAGGTDEFDAAGEGGVVGAGSSEGWQEGVVDVDDSSRVSVDELGREYLHIAGEDDQINRVGGE